MPSVIIGRETDSISKLGDERTMLNASVFLAMSDNVSKLGKLIWHKAVRFDQAMSQIQLLGCNHY